MADDIAAKLDILIKLQAAALTASMPSSKEKILFLDSAGLRPTLIAEILGTTANTVNVTLSKPLSTKPASLSSLFRSAKPPRRLWFSPPASTRKNSSSPKP